MRSAFVLVAFSASLPLPQAIAVTPVIAPNGIVNAASYRPSGVFNGGIAAGSIFVIFWSGLGPTALVQGAYPLQTQLGGTSVTITIAGATFKAPMLYTSATQLAAILPSSTPSGDGTLVVSYAGTTSDPAPIHTVSSGFGIFTQPQNGAGPAVLQNYRSAADQALNSALQSGQPGQVGILYGTGLGPVSYSDADQPQPVDLNSGAQILVGGKPAQVLYAGRSPCCAGLDQINFILPAGVDGCFAPVVVKTANGLYSNFASASISSSGGRCQDSANPVVSALPPTGTLRYGTIYAGSVDSDGDVSGVSIHLAFDIAGASFYTIDWPTYLRAIGAPTQYPPFGMCTVSVLTAASFQFNGLDAGKALQMVHPTGTLQLTPVVKGAYTTILLGNETVDLQPGNYQVTGTGGADVGAFQARATLPKMLTWTNRASLQTVDRSKDLLITWTPGDTTDGILVIEGKSHLPNTKSSVTFDCTEHLQAGRFSVPAAILSQFPATDPNDDPGSITISTSTLGQPFQASGLDMTAFVTLYNIGHLVTFK